MERRGLKACERSTWWTGKGGGCNHHPIKSYKRSYNRLSGPSERNWYRRRGLRVMSEEIRGPGMQIFWRHIWIIYELLLNFVKKQQLTYIKRGTWLESTIMEATLKAALKAAWRAAWRATWRATWRAAWRLRGRPKAQWFDNLKARMGMDARKWEIWRLTVGLFIKVSSKC